MRAVHAAIVAGELSAESSLLISNKSNSGAMEWARDNGLTARHISRKTHPDPVVRDQESLRAFADHGVELIVLSGYLQKIGPLVLEAFAPRILNIHPALLPRFGGKGMYGRHVHEAVLAAGVQNSGATVHVIDGEYDEGPVLSQREVPVMEDDTVETLAARVATCEGVLIVDTLRDIIEGRLNLPATAASNI